MSMFGWMPASYAQVSLPPKPNSYLYDEIGVLSTNQVQEVNRLGQNLQDKQGVTLILSIINICGDDQTTPEQFTTNLFNKWGIGNSQTQKGFLLNLCWNNGIQGTRRTFVSLPGKGLESAWPKADRTQITNKYLVPVFKQNKPVSRLISDGDLGNALLQTYQEYVTRLDFSEKPANVAKPESVQPQQQPSQPVTQTTSSDTWNILGITLSKWLWIVIGLVIFITIVVIVVAIFNSMVGGEYSTSSPTNYSGHDSSDFVTGMIIGQQLGSHDDHNSYSPPPAPSYSHHDDPSPAPSFDFRSSSSSPQSDSFNSPSPAPDFGGGSADSGSASADSTSAGADSL